MNIIISNSSDKPIYKQVKEQIKNEIITNRLKPGDQLPSIRALAKDLGISVITTKNAYIDLEREGYIETIPAKGTYVSNKNIELIKEDQFKKIERLIETSISIAKICGITKEDINSIFNILWEDNNE
ncbi:MAG TPA: GntR family transcriptional regulator [Tenericutes bacterium]|nr:GntR family transcriptional regulator [Mycoplasmatota bacterium]